MEPKAACVLLVDDDPPYRNTLLELLLAKGHAAEIAIDGVDAWGKLQAQPKRYDIVILDRWTRGMDGLEVLRRIKEHSQLQGLPVILQTSLSDADEIDQGLAAGAYHYLPKPFDEETFLSVLHAATDDRDRYRLMEAQGAADGRWLAMLHAGEFRFKTIAEARELAGILANAFPVRRRVLIGLTELLLNAVEHGNLGISYAQKGALRQANQWESEVERRLADPRYAERYVSVSFGREAERLWLRIVDQGEGFDWRRYLEISPERLFDTHGRGIALARLVSFDSIEYRGVGNEVEVAVECGLELPVEPN